MCVELPERPTGPHTLASVLPSAVHVSCSQFALGDREGRLLDFPRTAKIGDPSTDGELSSHLVDGCAAPDYICKGALHVPDPCIDPLNFYKASSVDKPLCPKTKPKPTNSDVLAHMVGCKLQGPMRTHFASTCLRACSCKCMCFAKILESQPWHMLLDFV